MQNIKYPIENIAKSMNNLLLAQDIHENVKVDEITFRTSNLNNLIDSFNKFLGELNSIIGSDESNVTNEIIEELQINLSNDATRLSSLFEDISMLYSQYIQILRKEKPELFEDDK